MNLSRLKSKITAIGLLVAASLLIGSNPVKADGWFVPLEIELEEGETETELIHPIEDLIGAQLTYMLKVKSPAAPWELEISIIGYTVESMEIGADGSVQDLFDVEGEIAAVEDVITKRFQYRDLQLSTNQKQYLIVLDRKEDQVWHDRLVIKLRGVTWCSMAGSVSGDVSRAYYGDVAFYNVFEEGVKEGLAAGTVMDPTANEALEGLTGFTGWLEDYLEDDEEDEEGGEGGDGDENQEPPQSPDWDLSGTDTFGLSITDTKFDGAGPQDISDQEDLSDPINKILAGDPRAMAGFGETMGYLGSSFSLAASGVNMSGPTELIRDVELSTLHVLPGAMDANYGGVKFIWERGRAGYARLQVEDTGNGLIFGTVEGELFTEKLYDGRSLRINLQVRFTALEGAFSCH